MVVDIQDEYKRTELGVIPEDWNVLSLGSVVEFLDGKRVPLKASDRAGRSGPFPYYGASGVIDYIDDYIFDEDLILLGEDGENILSGEGHKDWIAGVDFHPGGSHLVTGSGDKTVKIWNFIESCC